MRCIVTLGDEKHEISSEHYQAETCRRLEWLGLILLVVYTCIFHCGVHFLFVTFQPQDGVEVVASSTCANEGELFLSGIPLAITGDGFDVLGAGST